MKKFFAFTLAEVLITLGIIGVVAALTIPTLISKHQKKVYVTQLKKAVNTVQNGYKLMLADAGVDNLTDTEFYKLLASGSDMNKLNQEARKYFNIASDVKRIDSEYLYADAPGLAAHSSSGNYFRDYPYTVLISTVDGAEIFFPVTSYSPSQSVFIDANGYSKRPNVVGLDFFYLHLNSDASFRKWGENYAKSWCLMQGNSVPHKPAGCLEQVMKDNWEITYY